MQVLRGCVIGLSSAVVRFEVLISTYKPLQTGRLQLVVEVVSWRGAVHCHYLPLALAWCYATAPKDT